MASALWIGHCHHANFQQGATTGCGALGAECLSGLLSHNNRLSASPRLMLAQLATGQESCLPYGSWQAAHFLSIFSFSSSQFSAVVPFLPLFPSSPSAAPSSLLALSSLQPCVPVVASCQELIWIWSKHKQHRPFSEWLVIAITALAPPDFEILT